MKILFLDPIKKTPKSKREHELQIAAARSHAAKVAYRRSKKTPKLLARQSSPLSSESLSDENSLSTIYPGFGGFRSEVMNLLPSEACRGDLQALDFFVEVTMPGIDVANAMFDNSGMFPFLLPNLGTPVSYHSIMALIHLTGSLHRQPEVKASPLMLEHRGKAINWLRVLLDRSEVYASEALIIAIVNLATIEPILGNFRSYRAHLLALQLLERQRGGLKLTPQHRFRDVVGLYSDTTNALNTGRSAFKRRRYRPTYLVPTLPAQTPKGIVMLLRQTSVSEDTISLIMNVCHLELATPCVTLSPAQKWFFASRRHTVRKYNNYLDSVPILLVPDSPTTNPLIFFEKMLVLALSLFAWCGFTTIRSPQFAMYSVMMTQLTERLIIFEPATWIEQQCAAWMWLMVIDAWRVGGSNDGIVLRQGLVMLRKFCERFPACRSWTQVQELTRLFLWTGDMEIFWSQKWETLVCDEFTTI